MTSYTETELLICAMQKQMDAAKELIREMTPSERKHLNSALGRLGGWIDDVEREEYRASNKSNSKVTSSAAQK